MRPTTLLAVLPAYYDMDIVPLVEGSPGLGKTQLLVKSGMDRFGHVLLHNAPLMQPEDYGMPVVNAAKDGIHFVVPSIFPMVGTDTPDEGLIVIDELAGDANAGQKIWANIIQERVLHGQKVKPGWKFAATGNHVADRAGANRILSHLADRLLRVDFEPSLDDWCLWALENDVDPVVVSFLRFKPGQLSAFDPQQPKSPTPRGWAEKVSRIVSSDAIPKEAEFESIKGSVGEGAAAEFMGFLGMYRKLPNIDALLMDPDKAPLFKEPDVCFAIAGAIAHRAGKDNFERVMTYAKRMAPEFAVLTIRDSVRRCPEVQNTRAFIDWAMNEGAKTLM